MRGKSSDSGSSWFEYWLCQFPSMWSQACYLKFLRLNFICKMGIYSKIVRKIWEDNVWWWMPFSIEHVPEDRYLKQVYEAPTPGNSATGTLRRLAGDLQQQTGGSTCVLCRLGALWSQHGSVLKLREHLLERGRWRKRTRERKVSDVPRWMGQESSGLHTGEVSLSYQRALICVNSTRPMICKHLIY